MLRKPETDSDKHVNSLNTKPRAIYGAFLRYNLCASVRKPNKAQTRETMSTKNQVTKKIIGKTPKVAKPAPSETRLRLKLSALSKEFDQLKHIRKDYEEVMQNATEAIFKIDAEGKFYFVSGEFGRLLGYNQKDVEGRHFTSIVHPDEQETTVEIVQVLMQFGKAKDNLIFRVRHKDGYYLWVNCSALCFFDENGAPTHILGFAHDFTQQQNLIEELRSSEKALRISEERYHSLFDAMAEGIVMMDATGKIITCNKSAERIFNVSMEQILKFDRNVQEDYVKADGSPFPAMDHPAYDTLKTGQAHREVVIGIHRAVTTIWISVNTAPIYYTEDKSKPDAVVVSFIDITQAKSDREELQVNQQFLQLEKEVLELNARPAITVSEVADCFLQGLAKIFPGMYSTLLFPHPDGVHLKIVAAPGLPKLFSDVLPLVEIGPDSSTSGKAMFLKEVVITDNIAVDASWSHLSELAKQFGFKSSWSFPILNRADEVLGTITAYHTYHALPEKKEFKIFDRVRNLLRIIIENKMAEEEVKLSNEKYLTATKAMAQAVVDAQEKERADIGYELHDNVNQILSTSKLYLELAKNDETQRMDLISRSISSIGDAVAEIRHISQSLVPASIDDLGLIASVDDLLENIRFTKALNVEFFHTGDVECLIREKIKLVIFRIIQEQVTNALKHAEATNIFIDLVAEPGMIELSISDDGKGFDLEHIKTKKGVGLKNIANRVELVNGKIRLESAPGKGCKLRISIPI